MPIENVILVAAEDFLRRAVAQFLRQKRIEVAAVGTIQEAHDYLGKGNFDVMLLDEQLPDGSGSEFLREVNMRPNKPLVVFMGGAGSVDLVADCMRHGAFDYLLKPFSNEQVEIVIKKAEQFAQVLTVNQFLTTHEAEDSENEMIGQCAATERLRTLIRRVAQTQATVLIQGENGTGKELVARALHRLSPRRDGPFIKLNCAALPENLVESELFGHEKGSFTGAINKREGRFELAHTGSILLDEISEVSLQLQAKLLRVLQEREFERVGGTRPVKVDVRVIATTNRHLEQSVAKNEFRQDLYFRLNVVPIHVPPLRERRDDILILAHKFTERFIRKHGVRVKGLDRDAEQALLAHPWPGNIRELQNVIERAVILCDENNPITPDLLGLTAPHAPSEKTFAPVVIEAKKEPAAIASSPEAPAHDGNGKVDAPNETLADVERRHILNVLRHCANNRTQAAKVLDVNIRTLRNKLNEYKVEESAD
ncbi:MAG: sigma-54-dependent Fis family transcriptional regulator [Pedosphaera sp.]|nr:sigma-54-dependent Fis family transcriptional regulator [Pedosphaera sp.]MSS99799.1 sigma-54-dependent Fis family transcriptional regulator [Pedosphaera sp.]